MRVITMMVLCLVTQNQGLLAGDFFKGNSTMPISDPYFNAITFELIQTPVASQDILNKAAQGQDVKPYTVPEFPISSAKSYVAEFLRPHYQPPKDTHFLAFAKENNECDVVRAVYKIDNKIIRIAQSQHLFSIHIQGYPFAQGKIQPEDGAQDFS